MSRAGSEYLLEDGSPRYGVRTTGLEVAGPAALPVRAGQTADAAARLDAAELKMAVQHRFILDRVNHADAEIIAALRSEHPEELQEAEAIVAGRLESPKAWVRGARRTYAAATAAQAVLDGTVRERVGAAVASLGLSLTLLAVVIGLVANEAPPLPALAITFALFVAVRPLQERLSRKITPEDLPTRIDREEAQTLWDDVVNATLLAVLQAKGVTLDAGTRKAALRGWNHTSYVASVAQELRTTYAQP